jgi:HSP20 family protein
MANTSLQKTEGATGQIQPEATQSVYFTPRVDILENDNEITIFADMPGVRSEDADIRFENGELTLHGRCSPRQEVANYLAAEYGVGDFYRVFTINESIDADKITAELKNGVLTVHLPKSEAVKPRKIAVK